MGRSSSGFHFRRASSLVELATQRSATMNTKKVLLAALIGLALCSAARADGRDDDDHDTDRDERFLPKAPFVVKLIGFNDFHGNLQSPGTFGINTTIPGAQRPAVGGAEFLAAKVAQLRSMNPLNAVVGSGDFIGASPLVSALFFDEPAVETLNKIGLEFNAVGNHEFDKGSAELKRLQKGGCKLTDGLPDPSSCKGLGSGTPGTFDGAKYKWLSANVIETATGRTLLPPYGIKKFNGIKIAFIGMTLKGTPQIVTPTGVAGLEFRDEADTVNALVPMLHKRGVKAIVVLVHQGGFQTTPNLGDINSCDGDLKNGGVDSDIGAIVRRLDNAVDLVISGHTHAAYNCSGTTVDVKNVGGVVTSTPRPTGLPNKAGRLIPVTSASAFGRVVTDIDITLDPKSRDVIAVAPTNRLVDRTDPALIAAVAADPTVKNIVDGYSALVSPLAGKVLGMISQALPNTANTAGEMPAGSLIADAQLQATQPSSLGGAVAAFMNPGGVRNPGFAISGATYPYEVTYGNAFTVQPFGNSLVTLTLTTQQIKDLLEQQFVGCLGQVTQRILQVSNGIKYAWSATAPACSKIIDLSITRTDVSTVPPVATAAPEILVQSGVVQNPTKTWRVTVNNFLATGGDGFTVLTGGTSVLGGAQDIDALVAYLAGYKAPLPAYNATDAALALPRITRLP
jgi:5'-nucleotidase